MEKLSFKLDCFEGPLDLLITLVGKKKIEVWDINITQILSQYMEYLQRMREMDMEIASEFLAMASNLIYIKSRMLLPHLLENEEEDPRAELARSLQEYQNAKEASKLLAGLYETAGNLYVREFALVKAVEAQAQDGEFRVFDLLDAFQNILVKSKRKLPPPIASFQGIVGKEQVPVSEKIIQILNTLKRYGILKFGFIFHKAKSRSDIVATFLAVLELSKDNKINICGVEENGEFLNSTVEISGDSRR